MIIWKKKKKKKKTESSLSTFLLAALSSVLKLKGVGKIGDCDLFLKALKGSVQLHAYTKIRAQKHLIGKRQTNCFTGIEGIDLIRQHRSSAHSDIRLGVHKQDGCSEASLHQIFCHNQYHISGFV